jgi:thiosulfate/3-mercaptopyruvate sulfurtransferase
MSFGPLISPESLLALEVPVRLLDARAGKEIFAAGHLSGAIHADLNVSLSTASDPGFDPAKGGRHPLPAPAAWAAQLGAWGIGPETLVVAYDDASGGNGGCRLWWMLRSFGHEKVALLDGGLIAAQKAGMELTTQEPEPLEALPPYPGETWHWPMADIGEVGQFLKEPTRKVLDVRSRERWRGEVEPIDPVAGRIPGTLNLPYTDNLEAQGRYKSPAELRKQYLQLLDGTPPHRLTVHCGSGVTACHTLLALELAGMPGAALYVGSYSEWCRSGKPLGKG